MIDDIEPVDDGAMGGPAAWAAICDRLAGEGPTPPPCQPPTRLSGIEARLDEFGWQVRPCSTGGYFAWSLTGTKYCATPRELGKLASTIKAAAREASSRKHAAERKPTEPTPARSKSEAKNLARDRRVQLKSAFFDFLARQLARTTARRDEGSAS